MLYLDLFLRMILQRKTFHFLLLFLLFLLLFLRSSLDLLLKGLISLGFLHTYLRPFPNFLLLRKNFFLNNKEHLLVSQKYVLFLVLGWIIVLLHSLFLLNP